MCPQAIKASAWNSGQDFRILYMLCWFDDFLMNRCDMLWHFWCERNGLFATRNPPNHRPLHVAGGPAASRASGRASCKACWSCETLWDSKWDSQWNNVGMGGGFAVLLMKRKKHRPWSSMIMIYRWVVETYLILLCSLTRGHKMLKLVPRISYW